MSKKKHTSSGALPNQVAQIQNPIKFKGNEEGTYIPLLKHTPQAGKASNANQIEMSDRQMKKLAQKLNQYPSQKIFTKYSGGAGHQNDLIHVRSDDDSYGPLLESSVDLLNA